MFSVEAENLQASTMTTLVYLDRIRANAQAIRAATGVDLIGVVKANAYGLGAVAVADAISDLVRCWYVFSSAEASRIRLWEVTRKPTICTSVPIDESIEHLAAQGVRPAAWTREQLDRWHKLDPLLSVDTGMQRFACPPEQIGALLEAHRFSEAFTHASRPEQALQLKSLLGDKGIRLHAAGTGLLGNPDCWLDAVRPGLALYRDAARVSIPLTDARRSRGPVGYTGFTAAHHGVVLRGYSDGMRPSACVINGRRQKFVEVGMQTSFVTLDVGDKVGDEVVLLGDELPLAEAAEATQSTPHETLLRLASMGERKYVK